MVCMVCLVGWFERMHRKLRREDVGLHLPLFPHPSHLPMHVMVVCHSGINGWLMLMLFFSVRCGAV